MNISLAGSNTFEVGGVVQQYGVSSGGVVSLNANYAPVNARTAQGVALTNILGIDAAQSNLITQNYSLALQHALASGSTLATALNATQMAAFFKTYPTNITVPNGGGTINNSSLMQQLQMVAKMIEAGSRSRGGGRPGNEAADFLRPGRRVRSAHRPDEQLRTGDGDTATR